ncbi:MAG: hypothetical protein IJ660_06335 [Alphaproteobacteria bacterium]|nr:hypothetical protein [Alphaproteobacteria bacterium]
MNERLSEDKLVSEQNQLNATIAFNKECIWKNIVRIEALRKEDSLRRSQYLCKNLQIKV